LLVALLHDQRRAMGDLWVITASRRVAAWARSACDARGPGGTAQQITPAVLLVSPDHFEPLLDEAHPELAFFAAWAMQARHGEEAAQVAAQALAITDNLPNGLRRTQTNDILSVLNRRTIERLKEKTMDRRETPEPAWITEFIDAWEADRPRRLFVRELTRSFAQGKQESLLLVLRSRGLRLSAAQRAKIQACSDPGTLDRWLTRAGKATSAEEVLTEPTPKTNGRTRRTTARRTRASRSRPARAS
jgi:hypothetical protein